MSTTQVKVAAKSINLYNHVLHLLGMVVWTESGASGKMLPGMRMNGKENSGDLFDRFPYSYRKKVTHMKRLEGGSRAEEKKKRDPDLVSSVFEVSICSHFATKRCELARRVNGCELAM